MHNLLAKVTIAACFLHLATVGGTCSGDYQGKVAPDGTHYAYMRDPPNDPLQETHLYQWVYDADAGWQVGAHHITCSQTPISPGLPGPGSIPDPPCAAAFDPTTQLAVAFDQSGDAGLYQAAGGDFVLQGPVAGLPPDSVSGNSSGSISFNAQVIQGDIATEGSQPFLLTQLPDGGYESDAGFALGDGVIDATGDLFAYADPADGGPMIARRSGTSWTTAPLGVDLNVVSTSFYGDLLAGCASDGGLIVAAIAGDGGIVSAPVAMPDGGDCGSALISETASVVFEANDLIYRADFPAYAPAQLTTAGANVALDSFSPDGGALIARSDLPDGGDVDRVFYLGPLALSAAPGVALPDLDAGVAAPGAPLLSVALHGQPTDSETVQSISLQPQGTLSAMLVHLWRDVDGDGKVSPGDVELAPAQAPPADGGAIVFGNLSLQLARVYTPLDDYDAGLDAGDAADAGDAGDGSDAGDAGDSSDAGDAGDGSDAGDAGTSAGAPPRSTEYLLATVEIAPGAQGDLSLTLDPAQMQATTDSLGYAVHPSGGALTGAHLVVGAGPADAGEDAGTSGDAGTAGDAGSSGDAGTGAGTGDAGTTSDAGTTPPPKSSSGCGCRTESADGLPMLGLLGLVALSMRRRKQRR